MKKKHQFYSKLGEEKSFCPVSGNKQESLAERFMWIANTWRTYQIMLTLKSTHLCYYIQWTIFRHFPKFVKNKKTYKYTGVLYIYFEPWVIYVL